MNWLILQKFFAGKHHGHDSYVSKDELSGTLAAELPHDHDDVYYTESEIDAFLSGLAAANHTHIVDELHRPSGLTVATISSNSLLDYNGEIKSKYFSSINQQFLIDTAIFRPVGSETGKNRSFIVLGNNGGAYLVAYAQYNNIVVFHQTAPFNGASGQNLFTGSVGPSGNINVGVANSQLSIENRWSNNGWIGGVIFPIVS